MKTNSIHTHLWLAQRPLNGEKEVIAMKINELSINDIVMITDDKRLEYVDGAGRRASVEFDETGTVRRYLCRDVEEKYDARGNLIYYKNGNGTSTWVFDDHDHIIFYEDENGKATWYRYDENGNEIFRKTSDGRTMITEYDKNNKVIHSVDSFSGETWSEYDDKDRRIHFKHSSGFEKFTVYCENEAVTFTKHRDGRIEMDKYLKVKK